MDLCQLYSWERSEKPIGVWGFTGVKEHISLYLEQKGYPQTRKQMFQKEKPEGIPPSTGCRTCSASSTAAWRGELDRTGLLVITEELLKNLLFFM